MVPDDPFAPSPGEPPRVPPPALILPTSNHGNLAASSNSPESHLDGNHHHPIQGTRTPRRVQWTADQVIPMVHLTGADGSDQTKQTSHEHAPDLDHVNRALESFSGGDQPSTSVTRPDSEDYDHRLDPDPGDEGEDETRTRNHEGETIRNLLKPKGADNVAGYVQLGETDGLPTWKPEDEEKSEASKLVREHTGKWSNLRRRVRSGSVARKGRNGVGEDVESKTADDGKGHHDEKNGLTTIGESSEAEHIEPKVSANPPLKRPPKTLGMPHLPGGTSVLSSLLALYNNEHHHLDSGTPSAANTPQSSRPPSPGKEGEHDGTTRKRSKSPWRRRHKDSASESSSPPLAPPTNSGASGFTHNHRTKSTSSLITSVTRAVNDFRDDRPRSARSGAGVFGALVANTASMAAVAAPASSTLIPASTKPGFHLNRYSLTESPPLPSPPRAGSGFNFGSRPGSSVGLKSQYDRTESPGSRQLSRRSSGYSNDSKEDHGRVQSSDNLIEMKSKRRGRPSPLNLNPVKSMEKLLTHEPTEDDKRRRDWEQEKKRRKKAKENRKKQEVYIIQHVAAIVSRQQFILKLARALMMFGSPTHRLETQIQATAKVLDIHAQVVYLPNIMLISFADDTTHTSETKFLKQAAGIDLGKLLATHNLYWEVVHDRLNVEEAGQQLDRLMTMPPCYNAWQMIIIAGLCSSFIVIQSYYGSFLDAVMVAPLGMLLQAVQIIALKNDLFSGVFEIVIATVISFLSAVLASSHYFCYTSLVSGGIVLILPGFIVLSGALELASRNITSGAVRMGYSVIYSLFLGFGLSIGSEIYVKIRNEQVTNATNNTCSSTHYEGAPWYLTQPSTYWYFLTVPMFAFFLSLNLQQPLRGKELPIMVAFACAGWVTNYFAGRAFPGRSDIVSAIGSFCIGILGNLYGRVSNGASFPVMVTGILMQLPSGLKEGGLFNFANDTSGGSLTQYSTGFRVAAQLVSVAVGLTVGLFVAAVVMHPLGGSRRRGAGIFSF